uniref:Dimeris T4 recombination endonuclease VII n=1 Tax=Siphoviridae sp. ctiMX17 TaxID=2826432 RepID=A0A8S5N256_9CAUD|nr:MAG TPA: dimeris T4 recombination endonuclease VII [Siphoviridae sp. ctiMX17]
MFATVTYPYRDRETYEIHRTGDMVELTPERFAELSASGYVDAASPIDPMERADGVPEQPEGEGAEQAEADAPDPAPEQEEPEPAPAAHPEQEMTAKQLRDAIGAKGGFAPKKANKAQLAELLEAL